MKKERMKKPFAFHTSTETLKAFRSTSAEAKLNWLEDANRFVRDFVPAKKLEIWKKLSGQ
jgi:hypothetical protein